MAKTLALAMTTFSVGDVTDVATAIKNDVLSFNFSTPRAAFDVTGVDKSAIERLLGLADASITVNVAYNPAASASAHYVFKSILNSNLPRTTTITFSSTPAATMTMGMLYTDYPFSRGQDGNVGIAVPGVLADGTAPAWS